MNSLMWHISSYCSSPFIKWRKWILGGELISKGKVFIEMLALWFIRKSQRKRTCPELLPYRKLESSKVVNVMLPSFICHWILYIHTHLWCVGISIIEAWGVSIQWQMGDLASWLQRCCRLVSPAPFSNYADRISGGYFQQHNNDFLGCSLSCVIFRSCCLSGA